MNELQRVEPTLRAPILYKQPRKDLPRQISLRRVAVAVRPGFIQSTPRCLAAVRAALLRALDEARIVQLGLDKGVAPAEIKV
jgi:hypothetical protein